MSFREAFLLPNGSCLRYAYPHDRGTQDDWFRSFEKNLKLSRRKDKFGHPRLGLWSSRSSQHVISADFDYCPAGIHDFERLREYLSRSFARKAIVCSSLSGKAKCFFVAEVDENISMTQHMALGFLEDVLWPYDYDLFEYVDKSIAAISTTFLNKQIKDALKRLAFLETYDLCVNTLCTESDGNLNKNTHTSPLYDYFKGDLSSDLKSWVGATSRKLSERERFMRILVSSKGLIHSTGFDLPVTKLSQESATTPATIHNWLKDLIGRQWLECISQKYFVGTKAKTYRATGNLAEEIHRLSFEKKSKKIKHSPLLTIPSRGALAA